MAPEQFDVIVIGGGPGGSYRTMSPEEMQELDSNSPCLLIVLADNDVNLPALRMAMALTGYESVKELQKAELVVTGP